MAFEELGSIGERQMVFIAMFGVLFEIRQREWRCCTRLRPNSFSSTGSGREPFSPRGPEPSFAVRSRACPNRRVTLVLATLNG